MAPSRTVVAVGTLAVVCLLVVYSVATAPLHAHKSPSASRVAALAEWHPLAYRTRIDRATAPRPAPFDHVYVLSLPSRDDRRTDIRALAHALALDLEFVDAASKHEPFLQWIAEHVAHTRTLRRTHIATARNVDPDSVGGLGLGSDWLTPFPANLSSVATAESLPAPFPPYPGTNWVAHLEALYASGGRHTSLRPRDPHLNVTAALWDPRERVAVRQVHEGVLSTYWGQTRALERVLANGDRTALILEDDVDVEWDIERLWATVHRRLPRTADGDDDWDVAFLGHCWGGELQQPMYLHPLLHRSTAPMCLHGYAVTARGARRLLALLLDPWRAYSAAVDALVPSLLHVQRALSPAALALARERARERDDDDDASVVVGVALESWTVAPPLVVQRKEGPSDLQGGTGSAWRGVLRDSTVERIRRDDGTWSDEWDDRYDEERPDPATVLRCGQG
ncbi:hypothetical protein JCM3770_005352 [Rhodotorula araucariae]